MNTRQLARICHEVNRMYCASINDFSHKEWEYTPENIKQSVIDGVIYHLNNPNANPKNSHNNWLAFKISDGWTYGEVKDLNKKTHPCLIKYDDLPEKEKLKDTIFKNIVDTFKDIINENDQTDIQSN